MQTCTWTLLLVTLLASVMVFTGAAPAHAAIWKGLFAAFLVGSVFAVFREYRRTGAGIGR